MYATSILRISRARNRPVHGRGIPGCRADRSPVVAETSGETVFLAGDVRHSTQRSAHNRRLSLLPRHGAVVKRLPSTLICHHDPARTEPEWVLLCYCDASTRPDRLFALAGLLVDVSMAGCYSQVISKLSCY